MADNSREDEARERDEPPSPGASDLDNSDPDSSRRQEIPAVRPPERQGILIPPRVVEPPVLGRGRRDSQASLVPSEFSQWLEDNLGSESYGAPRVFDLYTLLAVTLAFALLFACLRLIQPLLLSSLPQVAISLGTYVTLIAIAQMILFGGNKPRIASVVAGPVIWLIVAFGLTMQNPRVLLNIEVLFGLACSSVLGIPAGYLGGAMVAGVFLVADSLRSRFMSEQPVDSPDNDDAIFKDE